MEMWAHAFIDKRVYSIELAKVNTSMIYYQKLELTCDRVSGDSTISELKKDPASAAYIPVRIREIIQETLSPSKWDPSTLPPASNVQPSLVSLLQKELKETQNKLSQTEKDCMELSVKYIAVNEKVKAICMIIMILVTGI